MILSLIGYRATGKTTVAKLLAEALNCPWVSETEGYNSRSTQDSQSKLHAPLSTLPIQPRDRKSVV